MPKFLLKFFNSVLNFVVLLALLLMAAYACYALWDNNRVYSSAEDVQADMLKLKPRMVEGEEGASFEELLAINPDVVAWLSLDHTTIDYPVLQGENNMTYFNLDVYGDFALAGSIYLDSRNDPHFKDPYSLLYGHHIVAGRMFGDLDRYKKEEFFNQYRQGSLVLPDRSYQLEVLACLVVGASEDRIFTPQNWQYGWLDFWDYVAQDALCLNQGCLEECKTDPATQILALSTCSSEYTDARTIVLCRMIPSSGPVRVD